MQSGTYIRNERTKNKYSHTLANSILLDLATYTEKVPNERRARSWKRRTFPHVFSLEITCLSLRFLEYLRKLDKSFEKLQNAKNRIFKLSHLLVNERVRHVFFPTKSEVCHLGFSPFGCFTIGGFHRSRFRLKAFRRSGTRLGFLGHAKFRYQVGLLGSTRSSDF